MAVKRSTQQQDAPEIIWVKGTSVTEYRGPIDTDGHDPRISGCVAYTRMDVSDARIRKLEVALIDIRDNNNVDVGTRNHAMKALL